MVSDVREVSSSLITPSSAKGIRSSFFPWQETHDEDAKISHFSFRKLARFPAQGAVGIIGSVLTPILSWAILRIFNNSIITELPKHLPNPAVWLSVVLSLNALFLHMAVSKGLAITWW
jgi:hypothetical protein